MNDQPYPDEMTETFEVEGLPQYLIRVGDEVKFALVALRARQDWPPEEFGRHAGIPMELWELWEDGLARPCPLKLYQVMDRLFMRFWWDSAMLDSVPADDDELWDAFNCDRIRDVRSWVDCELRLEELDEF